MFLSFLRSTRVLVIIYLAVITTVIYIGYNFYKQDKVVEWNTRADELKSISNLKSNAIDHWLQERFSDADFLFSNKPFLDLVQKYIYSRSNRDSLSVSDAISSIYRNHDYATIFILDAKSNVITNLNSSSEFEILKDSLKSALIAKRIVISNIYVDSLFNLPVIDIYIPLYNKKVFVGSVVLKINPDKIFYKILSSWDPNDKSGESLIVTPINNEVVFVSPLKFLPRTNKFVRKSLKDSLLPAVKVIQGETGIVEGVDYRGTQVLAYVQGIDLLPWYMVSKIDLEEVYEPVSTFTVTNIIIILLIVFLGGSLLLFYHTRLNLKTLRKANDIEQKFKSIFENSTNAIFLMDNISFIDCNRSAEEMFGVSRNKIIGKTPLDFSPEFQLNGKRTSELVPALISSALKGKPQRFEWTHIRNGDIIYADVALFSYASNHKNFVVAFLWDITEHKIAEIAIKESEDKYRNLVENIEEIVFAIDQDTKLTFINTAVKRIAGYNPEELIGKSFSSFIHPDDLSLALQNFMNLSRVKSNRSEYRLKTKDGKYKHFSASVHSIFIDSEFRGARGILMDITEKVSSAKHIKILTKAVEQSPVSVVITDPEGNIEYVNNKFTEVTGYSFNEVFENNPRVLKSGTQSSEFYKKLWNTIVSGNTWQGELHNKKKNGELYWENAIISPIVNDQGTITNFVAVKEDITERKRMIEELIDSKEKAEAANRLKSSFLANMSHELRTPLVGIIGFSELLSVEDSDPDHREMVQTILSSSNRLLETLNSLLDISRIEADKLPVELSRVNINEILRDCVNLFSPVAKGKGLFVDLSLPDRAIYLNSDKDFLLRIFNNLVNNAIKFTETGGVYVECIQKNSEDFIEINITDTGVGIGKEFQEVIFEPFRQASEGYSRRFEGTGLGLSIAKKYVELLNGTLTVTSELGKGSTFKVSLQNNLNEVIQSSQEVSIIEQENENNFDTMNTPSVLLVEDDKTNAAVISAYLKNYVSVHHVTSGEQAVNLCKNFNYDAILMDIHLEGISGIDAMNQIRNISSYYNTVPVIAITAFAMSGDKDFFLSEGFNYYLPKPFKRDDLIGLLIHIFKNQES